MTNCRPDHNLQDLRAKIFPSKRVKTNSSEVMASFLLPLKRKERSLSSLVVNTSKVPIQAGLTGKRSKPSGRKVALARGSNFTMKESIKKEEHDSSYSSRSVQEIVQNKQQVN